jgi:cytidylate kinase
VQTDPFDANTMAEFWNRLIVESVEIGNCVIVGRGGQCLLQRRRDTFHVSVYAPLRDRIGRIRERHPDQGDPQGLAHERDAMRAAYIERHFGQDVTDRHLYHLSICSSVGLEKAADSIICAAGLRL